MALETANRIQAAVTCRVSDAGPQAVLGSQGVRVASLAQVATGVYQLELAQPVGAVRVSSEDTALDAMLLQGCGKFAVGGRAAGIFCVTFGLLDAAAPPADAATFQYTHLILVVADPDGVPVEDAATFTGVAVVAFAQD